MNREAQGALEYLLILAGAVLIAAIVLTLLAGTGQGEEPKLAFSRAEAKCGSLNEDRCGNSDFIQYNDFCSGSGVAGDSCDLKKGGDGEVDCQWLENRCIPGRDFYSLKGGSEGDAGGGSGGGSGGGVSSGVVGAFEKKVWTSINAGETATVPIENGVIGVTEVSFSVAKTTYGASMEIKKLASLPSTVSSFSKKSYRTLEITQINVEKALKDIAVVKFKVEKAWLVDNKLEKAQVALHRYNNKQWNELPTSVGEDDGTYVYYSATTPGFSYFVIGEKTGKTGAAAAAVSEAVAPVVSEELVTEELEETAATTVEEAVEPSTPGSKLWLVPVIVGLVLVGLLYWYWKRGK